MSKPVSCEYSKKNLELDNIVSLGGNLWSDEHLGLWKKFVKIRRDKTGMQ